MKIDASIIAMIFAGQAAIATTFRATLAYLEFRRHKINDSHKNIIVCPTCKKISQLSKEIEGE